LGDLVGFVFFGDLVCGVTGSFMLGKRVSFFAEIREDIIKGAGAVDE
jgi:hypothetical protein